MRNKQNNKESKTYVQGLRLFGNTLPHGLKGILKKNGYNYSEIIGKWSVLVGKEIAKYAYPKSIKMAKGNTNGTLVLAVERGNEIEIEYSKNKIINQINSYFGYKLIKDLKLQSINSNLKKDGNKKEYNKFYKNFEKNIEKIENTSLKKSLSELIKVIKND
tara:strand:+ start:299 stop:781 length:483 start_codon:yes stop_codon:yes gene_type:complete